MVYDEDEHLTLIVHGVNQGDLISQIETLSAGGNTAADIGMKWGVAMLDPATQPVVTSLIASGDGDADLAGRPVAYDDNETLKVIILMTDGKNTAQYDIKTTRKSGYSNIYADSGQSGKTADKYSVWVEAYGQYYYPHDGTWNDYPIGADASSTTTVCSWRITGKKYKWTCEEVETSGSGSGLGDAAQIPYTELWATFGTSYVGSYFYGFSTTYKNDYKYSWETIVSGSEADDRLSDICTTAKTAGITIFTIGFEAPTHGQEIMEACATSSAHYYDVDGLEISEAFSAIAATIMKLKLIQ